MNCSYNYIPTTYVSTTLLLLQIFPSLSMSNLYVLELRICVDKEVSEGSILWTGNDKGNEDDEGGDEFGDDRGDDYLEDDDNDDDERRR